MLTQQLATVSGSLPLSHFPLLFMLYGHLTDPSPTFFVGVGVVLGTSTVGVRVDVGIDVGVGSGTHFAVSSSQ